MTTQASLEKQRERQSEARRTVTLLKMYRAAKVLLAGCHSVGPGVYRIFPADILALKTFTDEVTTMLKERAEV